ncbi:hypothetical protein IFT67_14380 [Sphingomonas sp. CFBP 13728]|uniref:hypothetical protein n=1 Tax=Sphingomonas sp. CFBP 13728 TaxID=2775294 RepID=UPI00177B2EA6|nr:hypothetical protein [Sphingomonas sp. CFBP 13728]MBD8620113.1 hypothetical protein [Sphingomonas sp. CFBP 13728]
MFDVGRRYKITTGVGENEGYSTFEVVAFEFPLLKVTARGQETVFNTSSPSFVQAQREMTAEEEEARWTDMPEYLRPQAPPEITI